MKLATLLNNEFHSALSSLKAQKLPVSAAYKIKSIQKRVDEELNKYEEIRKDLVSKYGKRDNMGNLIVDSQNVVDFDQDSKLEFLTQMEDLINIDIDVGCISVSLLGDKVELSTNDIISLGDILVD